MDLLNIGATETSGDFSECSRGRDSRSLVADTGSNQTMFILPRLIGLYESRGFQIRTSQSPFILREVSLTAQKDLSFTYLLHEGKLASPWGGGLHMTEVLMLQLLGESIDRKRVLVIGNSFGWSTFALALAFPNAKVVAIDACIDPLTLQGLLLTNRIAREEGLNVHAFRGLSPGDVQPVAEREFSEPIDLVLIDAMHDDAHQTADFEAARSIASPDCVYVFHDVIACRMIESFKTLGERNADLTSVLLNRTQSGMGMMFPAASAPQFAALLATFVDKSLQFYRSESGAAELGIDLPGPHQLPDVKAFG